MRINKINTGYFGGIHLVQVPKKFFIKPDDINECAEKFNTMTNNAIIEDIKPTLKNYLNYRLQTKDGIKVYTFLESPGYETVKLKMQELNKSNYSIGWLAYNSKTNLKEAHNPKYHSFFILTGDEKEKARKEFSSLKIKKMSLKAKKSYEKAGDPIIDKLRKTAKLAEFLDNKFDEIIKDKPIKVWKVDKTPDIGKIIKEILKQNG